MSGYTRLGIALLLLASASLIGAAAYAEHAIRRPGFFLYYNDIAVPLRPAVGPARFAAFVVLQHLLVGAGAWCLRRGMPRRAEPPVA